MIPWLLLLAVLTASCATLRADGKPVGPVSADGCATLDAGDVVRILSQYEVQHVPIPDVRVPSLGTHRTWGVAHQERRQILLNIAEDREPVRRLVLLHELQHVRHWAEGRSQDEADIRLCAIRAYKRIYGGDMDLPEKFQERWLGEWR